MKDIDFEGNGVQTVDTDANNNANNDDKTALNGGQDTVDVTGKDNNNNPDNNNNNSGDDNNNNNNNDDNKGDDKDTNNSSSSSTGGLEQGTLIEFDGVEYTVDENGNIVDKDGNVFKKADEVANWLKENNVDSNSDNNNNDGTLSIDSIREAVGIDVTDAEGKPVEFTNDAEGVKSYINSVIGLKANDLQQGAINQFFNTNPIVKQFVDYLQVNDGDPTGFGEIPDRSGIKLDKDNEAQLEAIIRVAAKEFGNKSLNENYIKYLKTSGALYDEAKNQLDALVAKDKAYRKQLEESAAAHRVEEERKLNEYWQGVANVISKRVIGNVKLPDSFVKEVDGQKITVTPNDFYDYLSKAVAKDEEGNLLTGYQRDLNKLSDEEILNKDLLDAWLMFTGGTYKDLINMATSEEAVRKLKIKSKQTTATPKRITVKANKGKVDVNDILLS